jgi:hypothetical protein
MFDEKVSKLREGFNVTKEMAIMLAPDSKEALYFLCLYYKKIEIVNRTF